MTTQMDEPEKWTEAFHADVLRFLGYGDREDVRVIWVDPESKDDDGDPCETCRFTWFAVEVGIRLPNGVVISEFHKGDMAEFLAAVAAYDDAR